jgi:hypothetical protein
MSQQKYLEIINRCTINICEKFTHLLKGKEVKDFHEFSKDERKELLQFWPYILDLSELKLPLDPDAKEKLISISSSFRAMMDSGLTLLREDYSYLVIGVSINSNFPLEEKIKAALNVISVNLRERYLKLTCVELKEFSEFSETEKAQFIELAIDILKLKPEELPLIGKIQEELISVSNKIQEIIRNTHEFDAKLEAAGINITVTHPPVLTQSLTEQTEIETVTETVQSLGMECDDKLGCF